MRVMASVDWNRSLISYNIGSNPPVANPEVNLLEAYIDDLYRANGMGYKLLSG